MNILYISPIRRSHVHTEDFSNLLVNALHQWMSEHPTYAHTPLYFVGSSADRSLPADFLWLVSASAVRSGLNLRGVAVGDPRGESFGRSLDHGLDRAINGISPPDD